MHTGYRGLPGWIVLGLVAMLSPGWVAAQAPAKPNIVYILCDDLGYGDVHALNPQRGKIPTPNIDRLAGDGMTFTDAHSGSSVCTPTRYGILTGRYSWRTHLQSGVLGGTSLPLIAPGRLTVASLLKQQGYATACIGKWHVGMQMEGAPNINKIDYRAPIKQGPTAVGFDYYFGIPASLDMAPFVFIENDRFTQVPTVRKKYVREGPAAADFEAVNVLPTLTERAVKFITDRAADAKSGKPFFLYLPLNSPHTPIVPSPAWHGKSGLGDYGDFVMQTDDTLGQVLAALDKNALADNTLIIFTSDNGCSPAAGVDKLEAQGHFPSAQFRGYKSDIWDGGHHIPFITRWPGKIKAGSQSSQVICLTDLMATCAQMLNAKLPDNAGEDSVSILPALLGTDKAPLREATVHHSIQGLFAIRQGNWKLEICPGSGGWSEPGDAKARSQNLPAVQLYDMTADVSERTNQQASHPEIVKRLTELLNKYIADGRSTPGASQANDGPVEVLKHPKARKGK